MVFGDKKLKGFAVRGTKYAVPVVDNAKFLAAAKVNKDANVAGEAWEGIKKWGTGGLMELKHFLHGSLITKNFQTTWYPDVVKIGGEEAMRTFWKRHASCTNCPTHCLKLGVLRSGKYAGLVAEGPEYESGGLLGSNLGMTDFDQMIALIEACDAYGLDNISTGGVLAFTTEAVEKGALKPTDLDGLKPKWGDGDTYMEMIRKIAYQEGKAGKLMAKGVAKMSKQIGKGSEAYANTVKGKELAAHDPRGDKIRAYSYTMGTCGGDHHEGQGPQALGMTAMADSLCICSFTNFLLFGAGHGQGHHRHAQPAVRLELEDGGLLEGRQDDHDGRARLQRPRGHQLQGRPASQAHVDGEAPGRPEEGRHLHGGGSEGHGDEDLRLLRLGRQGHPDGSEPQGLRPGLPDRRRQRGKEEVQPLNA